jgi:hypothetical protein
MNAIRCGARPVVWERVHARENWDFLHDMVVCFADAALRDRTSMGSNARHIARSHHDVRDSRTVVPACRHDWIDASCRLNIVSEVYRCVRTETRGTRHVGWGKLFARRKRSFPHHDVRASRAAVSVRWYAWIEVLWWSDNVLEVYQRLKIGVYGTQLVLTVRAFARRN